jgi:hypothetical protein
MAAVASLATAAVPIKSHAAGMALAAAALLLETPLLLGHECRPASSTLGPRRVRWLVIRSG